MAPKAVLVGMPGSGKSTIGRRLAKYMGVPLLDTDVKIVETTGKQIPEIFAEGGEAEFRRIEEEVVKAALAEHDGIVSLGGGAVTSPGVREALAGHTVVYLEISAAEGVRRTSHGGGRPLLEGDDPAAKYRALMAERVPLYRRVATIRINTNRRNPGAVVRQLAARLENPTARPAKPNRRRRRPPWRLNGSSAKSAQRKPDSKTKPDKATEQAESSTTQPTPKTAAAMAARRTEVRE